MSTITRTRGDTYPLNIVVRDKATRLGLDITGNSFVMSVSTEREPTGATYTFQSTGSITDAINGKVSFPISAANAATAGTFFFDIQMTTAGAEIRTISEGTLIFTQDISK